jgi:hypothetical protein
MTNAELLSAVKDQIQIKGDDLDTVLLPKTLAVKEYMLNDGISQEQIETSLGLACLAVGVMDLWNLEAGKVVFSIAFTHCLLPQLQVKSMS